MKRHLWLCVAIGFFGCSSAAKVDQAVKAEKDRCETYTSKLLGPVLGDVKSLKDANRDLENQLKGQHERVASLSKSNQTLSGSLQAKKGQLQAQVRELVEDKDELSRRVSELAKAKSALERERSSLQRSHEQLREEHGQLEAELTALRGRLKTNEAEQLKVEEARGSRLAKVQADMREVAGALAGESDSKLASFDQTGESFTVSLQESLLFSPGDAKLTAQGKGLLDRLGRVADKLEEREISVIGHSDNEPIKKGLLGGYSSHWDLASARAVAVARYLHEKVGMNPRRISAASRGEFQPAQPNDTPEGRQANRRVVLAFRRY